MFSQHTVPVASTTSLTLLLVTAMMEKCQSSFNPTPTGSDLPQDDSTCIIVYVLCLLCPQGIACNLDSPGFKFLHQATLEVIGKSEPHSVCGGLPLVRDLQDAGFDVQVSFFCSSPVVASCFSYILPSPLFPQVCGYGHSHVYHGDNEYCSLSAMQNAMRIFSKLLDYFNQ